ncbi:antiviral reverse transcriptase Drt2 [Endozoicomonas euniceicola]|uniref:Reverse transcriptase/maturase family protein n=1 Tax=Endozoicomonas euniceicola TaxID=1234143 RepID=A0ABY6GTX5_9GAMM|nr:antiviral reverse transcriptase Drt2 [Endozoicomonas euniceicola]UYM16240.1 reverse transcriptase/maturase family protein [Endozoicomonas euniceicola]
MSIPPNNSNQFHFTKRTYLHFDLPVNEDVAASLACSPERVSKHSFYPFLKYEKTINRVKRDAKTGKLVKNPKVRTISYASHRDSAVYSFYNHLLGERYERMIARDGLGNAVQAFRKTGKNNVLLAKEAFDTIRGMGECVAIGLDIKGFFDNIDHGVLKDKWCQLLEVDQLPADHYAVYKSITRYSYVDRKKLYQCLDIHPYKPRKDRPYRLCSSEEFRKRVRGEKLIQTHKGYKGLPQGATISGLLSNIYLMDFDRVMANAVKSFGGHYFRYCDDMLFIVPPKEEKHIHALAVQEIARLRLNINSKKEEVRHFLPVDGGLKSEKPLQFLGFLFDGQSVLLRSSSLSNYTRRVNRAIKRAGYFRNKFNWERLSREEDRRSLYRRKLYEKYSYLGTVNKTYLAYAYGAANIMDSDAIRKQLKPLWNRLQGRIDDESGLRSVLWMFKKTGFRRNPELTQAEFESILSSL